jgi:hypothetical protein
MASGDSDLREIGAQGEVMTVFRRIPAACRSGKTTLAAAIEAAADGALTLWIAGWPSDSTCRKSARGVTYFENLADFGPAVAVFPPGCIDDGNGASFFTLTPDEAVAVSLFGCVDIVLHAVGGVDDPLGLLEARVPVRATDLFVEVETWTGFLTRGPTPPVEAIDLMILVAAMVEGLLARVSAKARSQRYWRSGKPIVTELRTQIETSLRKLEHAGTHGRREAQAGWGLRNLQAILRPVRELIAHGPESTEFVDELNDWAVGGARDYRRMKLMLLAGAIDASWRTRKKAARAPDATETPEAWIDEYAARPDAAVDSEELRQLLSQSRDSYQNARKRSMRPPPERSCV